MNVLEISGLEKRFGEKQVLRGVDLVVPEKKVYGFVGRNGAGKTTTMKVILGLLAADAGEVTVCGEKAHYGNTKTNRFIGYLPDVPEYYGFMTPMEYLRFCGEISGLAAKEIGPRSEKLLRLVGLGGEKHRIKGFSRGMKQRLGIAQALLGRPRLLICDEPTSALDPLGRKEILDVLVAAKEETTILFSTHVLSDVEHICDEMALLNDGKIVMQGSIEEVKSKRRGSATEIQLEHPEDAKLLTEAFGGVCAEARARADAEAQGDLRTNAGAIELLQAERPDTLLLKDADRLPEVLRFLADHKIAFVRIEKQEATLEDIFLDVLRSEKA
ncbi:MAG: ABC transporter ATP-binding protein [Lachnospiraceae bacterium]|nr:ABC transporter ATP-binding protein [Lachnospiraceae bacterium]